MSPPARAGTLQSLPRTANGVPNTTEGCLATLQNTLWPVNRRAGEWLNLSVLDVRVIKNQLMEKAVFHLTFQGFAVGTSKISRIDWYQGG